MNEVSRLAHQEIGPCAWCFWTALNLVYSQVSHVTLMPLAGPIVTLGTAVGTDCAAGLMPRPACAGHGAGAAGLGRGHHGVGLRGLPWRLRQIVWPRSMPPAGTSPVLSAGVVLTNPPVQLATHLHRVDTLPCIPTAIIKACTVRV